MFRKHIFRHVAMALALIAWVALPSEAAKPIAPKGSSSSKVSKVQSVQTSNVYWPMDINNILNYYANNGDGSFNPYSTSNEGFQFPIGPQSVDATCIFEDGLVWTAFKNDSLLCGGSTYNHGLQPGPILQDGTASSLPTAADPSDPAYRTYRVRPDIRPTTNADTIALETNLLYSEVTNMSPYEKFTATQLLQQYWDDWNNWPADEGAPYTDVNHDGKYEPDIDIPGVPGADQTIWMVMNDVNPSLTLNLYSSKPIGIEVQRTIWAYNRPGALGNTIFISYKFINKSGVKLDSMYVSQWADPDLGYAGDDAVGCDTSRSLGYVYNGEASDANFSALGLPPPAVGFDFFQGPKVPGAATDTAIYNLQYVPGYKNLPMTAFDFFINGNATFVDPNLASNGPGGTRQWYNLMRGLVSSTGQPFPATVTDGTNFCYPGDPVTGTGPTFIGPAAVSAPADVRMCLCSGPFTMAPNDTQQVVVAALAGLGSDYLSSITALRSTDDIAQSAYNSLFKLAVPPPSPLVTASALNNKIVLSWGDPTAVQNTENYSSKGYTFEGYNVYAYQRNSTSGGKLIATYDKIDGIKTIQDTTFSAKLGTYIVTPTEYGTDSGIKHSITITTDPFTGNPIVNDRDYYFAVTAYGYNPEAGIVPHALESAPSIIDVRPQTTADGVRYASTEGDTLKANHVAGISDGLLYPIVISPSATTGDTYRVTFSNTGSGLVWNLQNTTTGKTVAKNETDFSGDAAYPIVDGIMPKVQGPPPEIRTAPGSEGDGMVETVYAGKTLTPSEYDAAGAPYHGNKVWQSLNSTGDYYFSSGDLTLASVLRGSDPENAAGNNFKIKFVDTTGNNWGWWAFDNGQIGKVPFQLWKYSIANGDSERLIPVLYSGGGGNAGHFALKNTDPAFGAPASDWIYWYSDTTQADAYKGQTGYAGFSAACNAGDTAAADNFGMTEYFARMIVCDYSGKGLPPTGTVVTINMTVPIDSSDVFTYTAPKNDTSVANAKLDIAKINVFPNPYFGFNNLETSKYNRFVRFTHLPTKATIRIFNLAGILVRTLVKDDNTQFMDWDLLNDHQLPIAAGMYIAYIQCPGLGTKTLKMAIIPEQQFLDHY